MRILIVEDDRAIADAIQKRLKAEHYAVDVCHNSPDAYAYLCSVDYDIALMDIMLPGGDGLSIVRRIRSEGMKTPVLFLTARDAISDRVMGLDAGGDDYLVKPFALDELMARIRVLARRSAGSSSAVNELVVGELHIDTATQRVTRAGRPISLTGREYALLEYMARNRDVVLTRNQIEQSIFNYEYDGSSNVVDVYIRYLRKKVDEGFGRKLIHTVRGTGYVLRNEE